MSLTNVDDGLLRPGERIGKYEILDRIGTGSLGAVYRALDTSLEREVALKVLRPHFAADQEVRSRFLDEARLTAQLDDNPGVVSVYDNGQEGRHLYLAMRLHTGTSLAKLLEENGRLPLDRTARIVASVSTALDAAHRAGIVHRDIKPGNILVGADDQAALTDFGLAKVMAQPAGKTIVGTVLGTPNYMSPEQVKGSTVGPASDIYSLGVTAYQMITGMLPYDAESMAAILYKQAHSELPPLKLEDRPQCSARVDAVVRRALSKEPSKRWPTATAFAGALAEAEAQCGHVATGVQRFGRISAHVGLGAIIVAAITGLLMLAQRPGDQGDEAAPSSEPEVSVTEGTPGGGNRSLSMPLATDTASALEGAGVQSPLTGPTARSSGDGAPSNRLDGSAAVDPVAPGIVTVNVVTTSRAHATATVDPGETDVPLPTRSRTPTATTTATASPVPQPPTKEPPDKPDPPEPTDPPPVEPPTREPPPPPSPPIPPL